MLELGVFHNGASDLPVTVTGDNVAVNKGSLKQVHEAAQRILVNQVRQGILADRLGFNYIFFTEHHFQPEGAEFSPNPLQLETAVAARTNRIRFGQIANIITWWHPIRIAEQAATLDVLSGGRLEFGIGRGYQPRENEVFGWPFGSTIQDQERNRAYYEEAFQIILKCWTEPSFSYRGEFYSIPPSFTKWHHKQTMSYFSMPEVERSVEDVLRLGPPDMYSSGSPVMASTTTLREISVMPQPLQKPYPQIWEPITSERSIRWTARNGVNCFAIVEPTSRLKRNIDIYYEECEKAGWPDRLGRGRFKYGWDSERRRGFAPCRYIHLALPGVDKDRDLKRFKAGLELQWDYYGPFGFAAVLAEADEPMYDLRMKVTGDLLIKKQVALYGTPADVAESIVKIKEQCGYEDFIFGCWFEIGGYQGEEIEDQMYYFAEEVMPLLARACGGHLENPPVALDLSPHERRR